MPDLDDSTLWRISAFERLHDAKVANSMLGGLASTLLPTTLLADLGSLRRNPATDDVLEVMAACLRHRENSLLYLDLGGVVWPVTLFPAKGLYHSPRAVSEIGSVAPMSKLKLVSAERPDLRPPGDARHDRVAAFHKYQPLSGLLWAVAMEGPRTSLLTEIGGRAAYRLAPVRADALPAATGALSPAVERLRKDAASLREMARWPGLSLPRASRMLNALYLSGNLMVTRSHPAARDEPVMWSDLMGRRR